MKDEQIIRGMEQVLELKGPSHVAPGSYRMNGEAYCIVGVLCQVLGKEVPLNNQNMAGPLFDMFGASPRMQVALSIAQYINDQSREWRWAKRGFDLAVEQWRPSDGGTSGCMCGCQGSKGDFTRRIIAQVDSEFYRGQSLQRQNAYAQTVKDLTDQMSALDAAFKSIGTTATGAFAQVFVTPTTTVNGKVTIDVKPDSAAGAYSYVDFTPQPMKKEHALVA